MIAVGSWTFLALSPPFIVESSPTIRLLHSLTRELVKGHFNGNYHGVPNGARLKDLRPGDVILLHNQNGAYGYWTHAVLYVGGGKAIDANDFSRGTILSPMTGYLTYDELSVFRPQISEYLKKQVVISALQKLGYPYNPFAPLQDRHNEYCSKLVWHAFHDSGVLLCPAYQWVLPDDLAHSKVLHQVADWKHG